MKINKYELMKVLPSAADRELLLITSAGDHSKPSIYKYNHWTFTPFPRVGRTYVGPMLADAVAVWTTSREALALGWAG